MSEPKLSPQIAAKYDCSIVPTKVEVVIKDEKGKPKYPISRLKVDLTKGTLKQADALVKNGFKVLTLKAQKKGDSSADTDKKK